MSVTTPTSTPASQTKAGRYLFGPHLDFLLLGGGSLIALLVLRLWLGDSNESRTWSLGVTLAIANIINHPHFAHSYQIFYGNFKSKLKSEEYPTELRSRYFVIGIIAPVAIISFLALCVIGEHPRTLGLAANIMFFMVGWHYAKQGYGMAMVDAVLKRRFYNEDQKQKLLQNAYATWIFSWVFANHLIKQSDPKYWGVEYFIIPIPNWLLIASGLAACITTLSLIRSLYKAKRSDGVAWNGLIAYSVSIYAWLLIREPVVLLWVPMFHSLQYLAVVWRFQVNKTRSTRTSLMGREIGFRTRIFSFAMIGFIAGYIGFWLAPEWLNSNIPYNQDVFGSALFFYVFWIFINIHHYLLDTVMWRKGNPDVSKHLFN